MQRQGSSSGSSSAPRHGQKEAASSELQAPVRVIEELKIASDIATATDETWQDALQSSLAWILSLSPDDSHSAAVLGSLSTSSAAAAAIANGKGKHREPDVVHWYCGANGARACWDASVFLIRLLSFKKKGQVLQWTTLLDRLLSACPDCACEYEAAKIEFVERFLKLRFNDQAIRSFVDGVNAAELTSMLEIAKASASGALTPAFLTRFLSNASLLQNDELTRIVRRSAASIKDDRIPAKHMPGLIALSVHADDQLRTAALSRLKTLPPARLADYDRFELGRLLDAHLQLSVSRDQGDSKARSSLSIDYTTNRSTFWLGITSVLKQLDGDVIEKRLCFRDALNVIQIIASHLSDNEDHFTHILAAFQTLLAKLGPRIWRPGDGDFQEYVLHSILDNAAFESLLVADASPSLASPYLEWLPVFLQSLSEDSELFVKAVAIVANAFMARYQQPRFSSPTRAAAFEIALALMTEILDEDIDIITTGTVVVVGSPAPSDARQSSQAKTVLRVVDMYAEVIVQRAFAKKGHTAETASAAQAALNFIAFVAMRENKRLTNYVLQLGHFGLALQAKSKNKPSDSDGAQPAEPPVAFTTAEGLWKQLKASMPIDNLQAVAALLDAVVHSAHLEKLSSRSWSFKSAIRQQMRSANEAMDILRSHTLAILGELADERQDLLLPLLSEPNVIANITTLLLSPVEPVYNAAQRILRQTFDEATSRRDLFRFLLAESPDQVATGLSNGLRAFRESARVLPETCGMAKRVVRCLSDVIDVLCATHDGLFREADFFKRSADDSLRGRLLTLWKRMCESLGVLFKRTPAWATFFENEHMTEWMRDAIMFGAELLNQARAFEAAVLGQNLQSQPSLASPVRGKMSKTGERMVYALNDPLEELVAWLRLNDEDLLASAFDLLCSMLERFGRTGVAVRETTIAKLRKFTVKKKDSTATRSSILRDDQLQALLESLDQLESANKAKQALTTEKAAGKSSQKTEWAKLLNGKQAAAPSPDKKAFNSVVTIDDGSATKKAQPKPTIAQTLNDLSRCKMSPVVEIGSSSKSLPPSKLQKAAKGPNFGVKPMRAAARPRGVPWTTYSSKAATTSSSEDDSDDGDGPGDTGKQKSGLAMLASVQKPTIRQNADKRQVKLLDDTTNRAEPRGPGRGVVYRQQQALSARLRGVQDVSDLHRHVLQWNPLETQELPPTLSDGFRALGTTFRSSGEYISNFEPLLLIECWDQIKQSMQELDTSSKFIVTIAGRADVDDFVEIEGTIDHKDIPERAFLTESDVVLLRQGTKQTLAKVQSYSRKREFVEIRLRCHFGRDTSGTSSSIAGRTKWDLLQLYSLSTVHREYAALHSLPYLTLLPDVLSPQPRAPYKPDRADIARAMKAYNVNDPQANAILSTLRTPGFSLIQGPPGTGKTKTILGLVGAFLDQRPKVATSIAPKGFGSTNEGSAVAAKLLVCAPSNAAVDEVARRIKEGIRQENGQIVKPKVVRIGAESAIDVSVKDIYIDELVAQELGGVKAGENDEKDQAALQKIRVEVTQLRLDRDAKKEELQNVERHETRWRELDAELRTIKSRINDLSDKLDAERDKAQQARRTADASQRRVRMNILNNADVICSTLSGAGHDYLAQLAFDFETVIIDEAAQSVELSSLIPLKYGCRQCIMVGDPLQLPPTVISRTAMRNSYDRSLFVRMMERAPSAMHLLSIQYRMNPAISAYPSKAFYQGRLKDGPNMAQNTQQPWHRTPLFAPYAFMHVKGGAEVKSRHHSLSNPQEAQAALAIYERLLGDFANVDFAQRVGIITPYKGQVHELRRVFRARLGYDITQKITFNTVDGFQGQEKDVIILSCVRGGSAEATIGFLSDTRRMNVALTRARSSLFILGDRDKLRTNQFWRGLVEDAEARSVLFEVDANSIRTGKAGPPARPGSNGASEGAVDPANPNGQTSLKIKDAAKNSPGKGKKREADEALGPSKASAHKEAIMKKVKTEAVPVSLSAHARAAAGPSRGLSDGTMSVDEDRKPDVNGSNRPTTSTTASAPATKAPPPPAFRPRPKQPPSLFIKSKRPGQK